MSRDRLISLLWLKLGCRRSVSSEYESKISAQMLAAIIITDKSSASPEKHAKKLQTYKPNQVYTK